MRWTLPVFLILLGISAVLYPLWTHSVGTRIFGSVALIVSLIFAAANLTSVGLSFSPLDAARKGWIRLAIGIWICLAAQLLETYSELVLDQIAYGTVADSLFLIGYLPLLSGLFTLIKTRHRPAQPKENLRRYALQGTILIAIYGGIFFQFIWHQVSNPTRKALLKFLDVAYPTFDFLLLALASVLVRQSLADKSKPALKTWLFFFCGLILFVSSDISLSYISDFQSPAFRFLDIPYFSSFFLIALAGRHQMRAMKSR